MGKTILITGASSGFGEACARKFDENGTRLILTARSGEKLESLKNELKQSDVYIYAFDIRDYNAIDEFFTKLPEPFQEIDVLVNNAGLALGIEPAYEAKEEDWEAMIDTNIRGLVRMTKRVLPGMVARNRGHIINIGSTAGNWPYPGGNVYGGTKAFVQQFSRNLRADLLGKKVRVSNIEPGMAETNFSVVRFKGDKSRADKIYENTQPLIAEDIAEVVYFVNQLPEHVNINTLEMMSINQAWGPYAINRD